MQGLIIGNGYLVIGNWQESGNFSISQSSFLTPEFPVSSSPGESKI